MVKIHLRIDQGTPQFVCSSCSNCHNILGRSLCSVKNRGCCWYFPKFTLHEIHKMVKTREGIEILDSIRKLPGIKVYNYYLHAKGYFDEEGYKEYLKSGQAQMDIVKDKSIFFRACPFVRPGAGCSIPENYRSFVCNFYICSEIYKEAEEYRAFSDYTKERNHYVKWIEWENYSLETLLRGKGLSLLTDFDWTINLLKDVPLEEYEFPNLPPVEFADKFDIGA